MTCNCDNDGSNEYIIELNQQGAPGVRGEKGEQGYSPTVSYISDGSGIVINIVNEQDTISTPTLPLKSYVDTLSDTKMNTDGSNSASSVKFNNLQFSYVGATRQTIKTINSQELLVAGQGLYLQGHASQAQGYPNSITIAPRGTSISIGNASRHSVVVDNDGASYDGNEIATVDQIPSITGKLNTDGSNATNTFTVNGVELAGNYVYINGVSSGGISVTQSNSDIFAKLQVDSSIAQLRMPGLYLNSGATGNISLNTTRDIVINGSNTSNKMYYHGTSANNEVAIKGDIPDITTKLNTSGSNADVNFTVNGIKLSANTISSSVSTGGTGLLLSQTTSDTYIDIGAGTTGTHFYTNGFFFSSDTSNQIPDITMSSTGDIKIYPTLGAKLYYGGSKTAANEVATKGNLPTNFVGCDSITGGSAGLVPAPSAGDEDKFLKADGTWDTVGGGGGSSYTAGTGIDITNDTISVDSTILTTNTAQTVTGDKTLSADIHLDGGSIRLDKTTSHIYGKDTNNNYRNIIARSVGSSDITIGNPGDVLKLAGNLPRLKYNSADMALLTDIPTVYNSTITFTQGGVTKGTITLNQSSNATIALDAGGGGGAVIDDTTPSVTTVYSSQKTQDLIDALVARIMALEANINGGNA